MTVPQNETYTVNAMRRASLNVLRLWRQFVDLPWGSDDIFEGRLCLGFNQAGIKIAEDLMSAQSIKDDTIDTDSFMSWMIRWPSFGMPVIKPTHGLVAKLTLTDAGEIDGSELKLPFGSFLIELPWPDPPLLFDDAGGRPTAVKFVTVQSFPVASNREALENISERTKSLPVPWTRWPPSWSDVRNAILKRRELLSDAARDGLLKYHWQWRCLASGGLAITHHGACPQQGQALRRWFSDIDHLPRRRKKEGLWQEPMTRADKRCISMTGRLLANLLLYIESTRGLGSASRSEGLSCHPGPSVWPVSFRVGEEVKIARELSLVARQRARGISDRSGWRLSRRFVVRGHWRMQACGPRRAERRRMWIEPFWKGPADVAEAMARAYNVL